MLCDCLPECHRVDFNIEVSPIALSYKFYYITGLNFNAQFSPFHRDIDKNTILIDIHFQYATMVKYRTDVLFGWLDLTGNRIGFIKILNFFFIQIKLQSHLVELLDFFLDALF